MHLAVQHSARSHISSIPIRITTQRSWSLHIHTTSSKLNHHESRTPKKYCPRCTYRRRCHRRRKCPDEAVENPVDRKWHEKTIGRIQYACSPRTRSLSVRIPVSHISPGWKLTAKKWYSYGPQRNHDRCQVTEAMEHHICRAGSDATGGEKTIRRRQQLYWGTLYYDMSILGFRRLGKRLHTWRGTLPSAELRWEIG